ncbi:mRNA interferase [Seminibacterium arietis]|uniref:mRNA interferase n=1 Tax=Seminibacterium arietis TaxID=1173502 RepID=A0ABW3I852_9PAST
MKPKQFLKYLQDNGVLIEQGKKHYQLSLNGNKTQLTRSSRDIPNATISRIKKTLEM